MRKRMLWALIPLLIVSTVLPFGCKPIPYYLQQVCKVSGTVTDAKSGDALESVEVSVDPYQYSELTNGLGDYELEMTVGTWTVKFTKEGYEPYSEEVSLVAEGDRAEVNAALVPLYTEPVDGTITVQLVSTGDHTAIDGKFFAYAVFASDEPILPDYSNMLGSGFGVIENGQFTSTATMYDGQDYLAVTFEGGKSYDVYLSLITDAVGLPQPGDYSSAQGKTFVVDGDMVVTFSFPEDFTLIQ